MCTPRSAVTAGARSALRPRQRRRRRRAAERRTAAACRGPQRCITIVWTAKSATGTRLVQARSDDSGRTFAKATAVPGGDAAGNRGWENAVADRNGRVFTVWLDHRELAQQDGVVAASHHDHAASSGAKPDGVAMAQRSKLYFASLDGAVAPRALTGGVCYCCKTALATAADGWSSRPGVTCIPATSATSRSRCRATAAGHSRPRCASARISGCSKAVRTMDPRWPSTRRTASTSSGRRWSQIARRGRADDRAVLRDVSRRHALHAAATDSHRRNAPPSADRDRAGRIADDRVGRRGNGRRRVAMPDDRGCRGRRHARAHRGQRLRGVSGGCRDPRRDVLAWTSSPGPASVIRVERVTKVAGAGCNQRPRVA